MSRAADRIASIAFGTTIFLVAAVAVMILTYIAEAVLG